MVEPFNRDIKEFLFDKVMDEHRPEKVRECDG